MDGLPRLRETQLALLIVNLNVLLAGLSLLKIHMALSIEI